MSTDSHQLDELVDNVRQWFERKDDWLIVFDGLALSDKSLKRFKQFLPSPRRASILITSEIEAMSNKSSLQNPKSMRLKVMDFVSAQVLLLHEAGITIPSKEEDTSALRLIVCVDHIPMCIKLIAGMVRMKLSSLANFALPTHDGMSATIEDLLHGALNGLADRPRVLLLLYALSFLGQSVPTELVYLGASALSRIKLCEEDPAPAEPDDLRSLQAAIDVFVQCGFASLRQCIVAAVCQPKSTSQRPLKSTTDSQTKSNSSAPASQQVYMLEWSPASQPFFRRSLQDRKGHQDWWLGLAVMIFLRVVAMKFPWLEEAPRQTDAARCLTWDLRQLKSQGFTLMEYFNAATCASATHARVCVTNVLVSIDAWLASGATLNPARSKTAQPPTSVFCSVTQAQQTGAQMSETSAEEDPMGFWPDYPTDMTEVKVPKLVKRRALRLQEELRASPAEQDAPSKTSAEEAKARDNRTSDDAEAQALHDDSSQSSADDRSQLFSPQQQTTPETPERPKLASSKPTPHPKTDRKGKGRAVEPDTLQDADMTGTSTSKRKSLLEPLHQNEEDIDLSGFQLVTNKKKKVSESRAAQASQKTVQPETPSPIARSKPGITISREPSAKA
ncbi:hypothetical protein KEM52_002122, partial [Ascosphaera acerosa]